MRGHATRWSVWLQMAIGVSIVVAIAGGIYYKVSVKPEDTLYIELGALRSRAAEVTRVADDAAAQRLTGRFIEAQSQQLAKAVAKLREKLAKAQPSVHTPAAARAHELAGTLLALAQTLAQKGESQTEATAVRDQARAIENALIPIERAARPS